jgi:hypothetical protein
MPASTQQPVRFADCYVLARQRTRSFIRAFLDRFLPQRQEYTDVYEVPQFAEQPTEVFPSADDLLEYLETHPHEVHAVYWFNPQEATLRAAMALFTSDAQVILGLTCETLYPDTRTERDCLTQVLAFCGSTIGLIEYEKPAPRDTEEMMQRIAGNSPTHTPGP